jgi:hypothetical protein
MSFHEVSISHLEHLLCTLNGLFTQLHYALLYAMLIWQIELGEGMVCILKHVNKLRLLYFIKWLITSDNPLSEKMLKF